MTLIQRIEQHHTRALFLLFTAHLLINNTINAFSVWSELNRSETPRSAMWEPFVWEYSSALSILILLPAILWFFGRFPLLFTGIKKQLVVHILGSIIFTLFHVGLMVAFREIAYLFSQANYDFGQWLPELLYEYRKDAWSYICWLGAYNLYTTIMPRLKGEATVIATNEEETIHSPVAAPEHFLVKKLDKEFLVKVNQIEYLESASNYVNLHSKGRIYPLRATLKELSERLEPVGFSRIHRSYAVNHQMIDNISYQHSGDGEITLLSGKKLNLSRRYKDALKQKLS